MVSLQGSLILTPAKTGGWTIEAQTEDFRVKPVLIAAYTNDTDMLDGLADLVSGARKEMETK